MYDWPIGLVVECFRMTRETGVQSQVESYQRLKTGYLLPLCLKFSIIRYVSRAKCSVTANWLKSQNGTSFSHVWRRGRLALDPLQNKSCSEFFSQACKNWHITWGNNLGSDWPPLAKGFQISHYHTPTRPLNFFPLDNRRIWAYRF